MFSLGARVLCRDTPLLMRVRHWKEVFCKLERFVLRYNTNGVFMLAGCRRKEWAMMQSG